MAAAEQGLLARLLRRGAGQPAPGRAGSGRLVLHLGDFKTGSTAIQSWLQTQGAAHGIATPAGFNQAALAQGLTAPEAAAEALWTAAAQNLAGKTAPHLVISAEHFEMSPPDRLAAMLDRHLPDLARDARAIVYVRPHPGAYLARLAESVKIGSHMGSIADYLDRPDIPRRMAYGTRLAAWAAAFGNRLTVRLYDPALLPGGDVVRDFAAWVTGTDPGPLPPAPDANRTPGLAGLARARALHLAIGTLPATAEGARHTLGRAWGRLLAAGPPGKADTALHLDQALALRLRDTFQAEAARADALFFRDAPLTGALDRALQQAPPDQQSLDPAAQLDPAVLAEIARTGALLRLGLLHLEGPVLIDRLWHE